jgi:hypothetical protein
MKILKYIRSSFIELWSYVQPKTFVIGTLLYLLGLVIYYMFSVEYTEMSKEERIWACHFYLTYDVPLLLFFINGYYKSFSTDIRRIALTTSIYQITIIIIDFVFIFAPYSFFNRLCQSHKLNIVLSLIAFIIVLWNTLKVNRK